MELVLLTALGVGGATIFGSLMGFVFKDISHRFSDIVLSFAAGVMLSAAILGLILPSVEYGGASAQTGRQRHRGAQQCKSQQGSAFRLRHCNS